MTRLSFVPTLAEVAAKRGIGFPKGKSRLEDTKADEKRTLVDERAFRTEVWDRDQGQCRRCERKLKKTMSRVPNRAEVHHIHGRGKDLRFEARAALLLCLECHEKVTGRVNEKLIIVASKTFTMRGEVYTDARHPVKFEKVV